MDAEKKVVEGFGYAAIAASIEIVAFEEGREFIGQGTFLMRLRRCCFSSLRL
jgi:hypothetical protein